MLYRHLIGYIPAHAANALVGFGGVAVLTRLLTPAEFGRYSLALSAIFFVHQALFTWLEAAIARRHAAAEATGELADELASAYAAHGVIAAVLGAAGLAALMVAPIADDMRTLIALGLGVILVNGVVRLGIESRRAAREVARASALQTTQTLLGFVAGVGFILATDLTSAGPIAGLLVGAAAVAIIDVPSMLTRLRKGRPAPGRVLVMASYGGAVALSLALEQMPAVADRFLIAAFIGEAATGVYSAGYGLANRPLDILFVWAGLAAAPLTIAALESSGAAHARTLARRFAEMLIVICAPAAAGLALVAEPLAGVMVGEAFRADAARIIPPIALGGFLAGAMTYYFHQSFTLARRTGLMAAAMVVPAVGNVALNLWWLPVFGVMGAAWATVAAYAAGLVICAVWGARVFALPIPWATLWKAALACAVMAVGVRALPPMPIGDLARLAIDCATGAAIYGAAALSLNIAGCRDWLRRARLAADTAEAA